MTEKLEVVVARIDANVGHIKKKIDEMKKDYNGKIGDHETRIRDNERFKQRGYGALGILGVIVSGVVLVLGWIVIS